MACPEGKTKDGFETQFGTNHVGHFLLFQLLKPTLLASSTPDYNSRVVRATSCSGISSYRGDHVYECYVPAPPHSNRLRASADPSSVPVAHMLYVSPFSGLLR